MKPGTPTPAKPIHVVHVLDGLERGGLQNGVIQLLEGLDPARFRQSVVCLRVLGPLAARAEAAGARVIPVERRPGRDRRMVLKLRRVLRDLAPDVAHTRNFGTLDGIPAARLAGVPAVVHGEHGWEAADPDGSSRRRRRLRRWLSPFVTRFVTVSEDLARWLAPQGRRIARKLSVIPNGVDLRALGAGGPAGRESFVIGTLGRLDPVKDQALLLAAFERIAPDLPGAELRIGGAGPLADELERAARSSPAAHRIHLLGALEDRQAFYRDLDLFVLPSRNEGLSNTLLEAMASALPVVASRVGGNPEVVADGKTGVLFPAGDVEALATALRGQVLEPLRGRELGSAGRQRAEERFSLEAMLAGYADLYAALAG